MKQFLHLSYLGTRYFGWQRQPNHISVQATIEDTISKMLKLEKVVIYGCGRTDAGVHASQYFAHVDLPTEWDYNPIERLNRMLPSDISIHDIILINQRAHAQYDADFRTYQFHLHTTKQATKSITSTYYHSNELDKISMIEALDFLKKVEDFRSLCKVPDRNNHTLCNLTEANVVFDEDSKSMVFTFRANRFLQRQIRFTVGKIMEIGTGELSLDNFKNVVLSKEPFGKYANTHPQGLFLTKVEYPDDVYDAERGLRKIKKHIE